MAVAEKFGQLPDTVENEMSEYWLNRVAVYMEAQSMDNQRKVNVMRERSR